MKDVNLRRDGGMVKFWKAAHGDHQSPPDNFCPLWWQCVVGALTIWLWWLPWILDTRCGTSSSWDTLWDKIKMGLALYLLWAITWVAGYGMVTEIFFNPKDITGLGFWSLAPSWVGWVSIITGPIICAASIAIVVYACIGFVIAWKWFWKQVGNGWTAITEKVSTKEEIVFHEKRPELVKSDSAIKAFLKAWYTKNCPKINWIEPPEKS